MSPGPAEVGPRHAEGNRGWNEPVDDAPETAEGAFRRDDDPLDHADREVMVPADEGTLAEQRPLVDEEGDDVREYTGEPVETDEGWVVPQTQNRGDADEG